MIKCKSDTITETIAEINSVLESLTLEQFQKILEDNRSYIENCEYFSMEEYCLFLFWNFKTKKITLKPEWDSTVPILMIEQVPLEESYTTMMGDRRYNQTIQEQIFNSSELFSQERLDKMIGNTQTWYKEFLVDKEKLSCFLSGKYWNGIKFDCYKNISNGLFPFSLVKLFSRWKELPPSALSIIIWC